MTVQTLRKTIVFDANLLVDMRKAYSAFCDMRMRLKPAVMAVFGQAFQTYCNQQGITSNSKAAKIVYECLFNDCLAAQLQIFDSAYPSSLERIDADDLYKAISPILQTKEKQIEANILKPVCEAIPQGNRHFLRQFAVLNRATEAHQNEMNIAFMVECNPEIGILIIDQVSTSLFFSALLDSAESSEPFPDLVYDVLSWAEFGISFGNDRKPEATAESLEVMELGTANLLDLFQDGELQNVGFDQPLDVVFVSDNMALLEMLKEHGCHGIHVTQKDCREAGQALLPALMAFVKKAEKPYFNITLG